MGKYVVPQYKSRLSILETEIAIKEIKDFFELQLATVLNLTRVSAPLFVFPETGLNDNLNGVERPVSFDIPEHNGQCAEIVHSLAKWKRFALHKYGIEVNSGLYTDMNAIRRDETTDAIHSLYVDQWDWEKVISKQQRNQATLKQIVDSLFDVFKSLDAFVTARYPIFKRKLPDRITYVTSQQLEDRYPDKTPKEREDIICKQHKAVFLMEIGGKLKSGSKHDGRAPDYDDWKLNGDILLYSEMFDCSIELSSMGIRVDEHCLMEQLELSGCPQRADLPFQRAVLNQELPYSVGGGIGQSRLCMYFLEKAHIGEVQASIWTEQEQENCRKNGITLL